MLKHWEHHFDNSRTEGSVDTLCDHDQNLLFTFTWNVKKAQNNFVPIFNSKSRGATYARV